jgi:hypothetical protein
MLLQLGNEGKPARPRRPRPSPLLADGQEVASSLPPMLRQRDDTIERPDKATG